MMTQRLACHFGDPRFAALSTVAAFHAYIATLPEGLHDGLNGRDGYLDPDTVWELHDPPPGPGEPYAFGWGIMTWPPGSDFECHWHNGSGGTYYALIQLVPELDLGISILTNGYGGMTERVVEELAEALFARHSGTDER